MSKLEKIGRQFFGLDAEQLDSLVDDNTAEAPKRVEEEEEEDFGDILKPLGEDENPFEPEEECLMAPSPSAGFGMGGAQGSTARSTNKSTMWEGLGVEDDGMGLREVSNKAAEYGYSAFLDEVDLIGDVFMENGEVQLIREKPEKFISLPQADGSACSAADKLPSNPDANEAGKILAIRVQAMPPRVLQNFNDRIRRLASTNRSIARCFSKGLFVVATYIRGYPDRPPLISVEPWHNLLPSNGVIELNKKIVEILTNNVGAPVLMPTLMMIAQEVEELIEKYEEGDIKGIAETARGFGIKARLLSESMHPDRYLGSNLAEILSTLPRNLVINCVENIMRTDLALAFEKMQRYLFNKNVKPYAKMKNIRNAQHILQQAEAVPAFHGTRMDTVGYIVRDGLLVPGGDSGISVRCGSRFGNGIYSSPDPQFASMYAERSSTGSYKLILCAVLLGKRDTSESYEAIDEKCDSRVADEGRQYVVFHRAMILPCYVLHLKILDPVTMEPVFPELKKILKAEMKTVEEDIHAGFFDHREVDKKRKAVLKRLAMKNLPFGFGPKGINFIVEDMADVSDEDDYMDCVERIPTSVHNATEEQFQHESAMANRHGTTGSQHPKFGF